MEYLAAFLIFALAVAGMAIGVIISRKRLRGSCGGLANMRDEHGRSACDVCTNPAPDCRGENEQSRAVSARSEATRPGSDPVSR